jgi:Spy/CpxP family protein refolding chaperone
MDKEIQYKTTETKRDWFSNHVLTREQVAQLIENKFQRAKVYQEATKKANKLAGIT